MLLVIIMIAAAIYGGAMRPEYSHVKDSISELVEVGAPNKALLDLLIGFYHFLYIPFAAGLHWAFPRVKHGWLGPVLLGAAGLIGIILTAYFTCDVGCEANPTTVQGKGHGIVVAINVLFVLSGMLAIAMRMQQHKNWEFYAKYTLVSALLLLGLGLITIPLLNTSYTGLGERIALIPLYAWIIVIGFRLIVSLNRPTMNSTNGGFDAETT